MMSLRLGSLQLLSNPNTNLHNMKIFHINPLMQTFSSPTTK
uniref:Uncharacterized protein n=1 Tax=Cucumis melo TaxID=3656 RepID=A0A9I9DWW5_CUCME